MRATAAAVALMSSTRVERTGAVSAPSKNSLIVVVDDDGSIGLSRIADIPLMLSKSAIDSIGAPPLS